MALSDVLSEIDEMLQKAREDYPDTFEASAAEIGQARCQLLMARLRLDMPPNLPAGTLEQNPVYREAREGNIAFYDALMADDPDSQDRMTGYGASVYRTKP